jgi:hypothetical protein
MSNEFPREEVIKNQAELIDETFEVNPEELEKLQGGATPVFAPMYGIPFRPLPEPVKPDPTCPVGGGKLKL